MLKVCTKCQIEKDIEEFSRRGEKYKSWCKGCCRDWYAANREKLLPYKKQYYQAHKEDYKKCPSFKNRAAYGKQYRAAHKSDTARRNKAFREKNPGYSVRWYQANLEERRKYHREWCAEKRKCDIGYRLLDNTRRRLRSALEGKTKSKRTLQILGCSPDELKQHLEAQFVAGMSWDNFGKWEIDHIIPCAAFDLTKEEELLKCFHFSNLQPLWASENRKKSDKLLEMNGSQENCDYNRGGKSTSDSIHECTNRSH